MSDGSDRARGERFDLIARQETDLVALDSCGEVDRVARIDGRPPSLGCIA